MSDSNIVEISPENTHVFKGSFTDCISAKKCLVSYSSFKEFTKLANHYGVNFEMKHMENSAAYIVTIL